MVEFSVAVHKQMIEMGYMFLLYRCMDHFAFITPMHEEAATDDDESYSIPIMDPQAFEMASGVEEFSFYVFP